MDNNERCSMIISPSINRENPDASILLIGHKSFGENDLRCIKYVSGKEAIALYDLIFEAGEIVPNGKEAFDSINTLLGGGNT